MWKVTRVENEPVPAAKPAGPAPAIDPDDRAAHRIVALKVSIHRALIDKINLPALEKMSRAQIEAEVGELVIELLEEQQEPLNARERASLVAEVLDELIGLSDTIHVMLRGRLVGTVDPQTVTPEQLGSAMTGAEVPA